MTPRELMAAFDVVADAPDGIKRLRELVLSLAVRGKLLPSAHAEWLTVSLSTLVEEFQNGTSSRGGEGGPPVVVIRLADIKAGQISADAFRRIDLSPESAQKYELHEGDVLAIRVNGSGDLVGRLVIVEKNAGWCYCDHLIRMRLRSSRVNPRFLQIYASTFEARAHLSSVTVTTAGQKTINQKGLGSLQVPLPPLAEQHRIVARVDELMALLDRLESAHKAREEARRAARDAALAALRDAEDADAVETAWARIAGEMGEMLVDVDDVASIRQVVLQLAVGGLLVPCTIRWTPLAKLLREPLANGRSVPDGTGYPVLRLTALRGEVVDTQHQKLGSWEAREGCRFRIEAGDLLVVRGNGSKALVARSAMVLATEEVAFPDTAIRLRPDLGQVTQRYLYYAWEAPQTRAALEELAKTTAGIWKVSQDDLYGISLPVPDLPEQHRIVAKVDALMALCDTLEARLRAAHELHSQLAAAAVHHLDV